MIAYKTTNTFDIRRTGVISPSLTVVAITTEMHKASITSTRYVIEVLIAWNLENFCVHSVASDSAGRRQRHESRHCHHHCPTRLRLGRLMN